MEQVVKKNDLIQGRCYCMPYEEKQEHLREKHSSSQKPPEVDSKRDGKTIEEMWDEN